MVKPQISYADFQKLDLRVGKIIKAEPVEVSQKLMRLTVDLGKDYGVRKILGGLQGVYKPQDLEGKLFVFLANLEPKKMVGEESNGMILAAFKDGKIELLKVSEVLPGTAIC